MTPIRRLTLDDLPAYHSLRLRALQSRADAFTSSYEEEAAKSPLDWRSRVEPAPEAGGNVLLGAFEGDDLVGVVGLERKPRAKEHHKAVLYGMYVHEGHEGKGIGRALMKVCLQEARAMKGLERVLLTVTSTNLGARHLYASEGFQLLGTEKNAIKVGDIYFNKDHMLLALKP